MAANLGLLERPSSYNHGYQIEVPTPVLRVSVPDTVSSPTVADRPSDAAVDAEPSTTTTRRSPISEVDPADATPLVPSTVAELGQATHPSSDDHGRDDHRQEDDQREGHHEDADGDHDHDDDRADGDDDDDGHAGDGYRSRRRPPEKALDGEVTKSQNTPVGDGRLDDD